MRLCLLDSIISDRDWINNNKRKKKSKEEFGNKSLEHVDFPGVSSESFESAIVLFDCSSIIIQLFKYGTLQTTATTSLTKYIRNLANFASEHHDLRCLEPDEDN